MVLSLVFPERVGTTRFLVALRSLPSSRWRIKGVRTIYWRRRLFVVGLADGWSSQASIPGIDDPPTQSRRRAAPSRCCGGWRPVRPPQESDARKPTNAAAAPPDCSPTHRTPRPGREADRYGPGHDRQSCSTGNRPRAPRASPQRVGLDVPQHRQEMVVVLNHRALESPLPNVPARSMEAVVTLRVRYQQALRNAADRAVSGAN